MARDSGNSDGKPTVIEDANIAAFLSLKGLKVVPFVKNEGSVDAPVVVWNVHSGRDKVTSILKSFYADEQVGVSSFVRSLKDIRSAMYNLKSISSQ